MTEAKVGQSEGDGKAQCQVCGQRMPRGQICSQDVPCDFRRSGIVTIKNANPKVLEELPFDH